MLQVPQVLGWPHRRSLPWPAYRCCLLQNSHCGERPSSTRWLRLSFSTPGAAVSAVISEVPADVPSANLIDITEEPCVPMVAAVLPNASSWVASGDWTDDECAPFSCSNNFWRCLVRNDNLVVSSTPLKALIEDGSAVVLIRTDVADALGLQRHHASVPFTCSAAFSGVGKDFSLSSYVKLQPLSMDKCFISKPLRAFISPSLVSDAIFGLPFLKSNGLVLDHGSGSCTARLDNVDSYDLFSLDPMVPSKVVLPLTRLDWLSRESEAY